MQPLAPNLKSAHVRYHSQLRNMGPRPPSTRTMDQYLNSVDGYLEERQRENKMTKEKEAHERY